MNRNILFLAALLSAPAILAAAAPPATVDSGTISGLGVRNIGSAAMSGRIASFDAINMPNGKLTIYVGAASGGVWKSMNGGTTFEPVFDKQPVQSIGAVVPSTSAIPTPCGSARARPGHATASRSATASTRPRRR